MMNRIKFIFIMNIKFKHAHNYTVTVKHNSDTTSKEETQNEKR